MGRKFYLANFDKYFATLLIFVLLFAEGRLSPSFGFLRRVIAPIAESNLQWMLVLCLSFYLAVFLVIELRSLDRVSQFRARTAIFFLSIFCLIALLRYALGYGAAWRSTTWLVILSGILVGKTASTWMYAQRTCQNY